MSDVAAIEAPRRAPRGPAPEAPHRSSPDPRKRRRILAWAGLAAIWAALPATTFATSLSAPTALHPARDLAAEARAAAARGEPLILMYSREGCAWCERLRREQLLPLLTGTAAPPVIREIHIDRSDALVDFDSRRTTSGEFARARKMTLAPTLAFHGPDGRWLAEPIIGYRLPDFYGVYLERAIAEARQNLAPGASR